MSSLADASGSNESLPEADFGAERLPIAVELAAFLERQIIVRRIAPGTRLVEAELCSRYRVSRSPLREALWQLEAGGLAVRRPHYGVRVAPMTLENLDHVFTCRVPLEALVAANVARRPRAARRDIADDLQGRLAAMDEAVAVNDPEAAFDANVALTTRLHQACDNPVLRQLLEQIDKPALRYRHWAYTEQPDMPRRALAGNRALITAIAEGLPDRAELATAELVQDAWKLVRTVFAERGAAPPAEEAPERFRR